MPATDRARGGSRQGSPSAARNDARKSPPCPATTSLPAEGGNAPGMAASVAGSVPSAVPAPTPRVERVWPQWTSWADAVPAALLVAGCGLTALAAHHSSRAHGALLLVHLIAGGLGLLLPLSAVAWVVRRPGTSTRHTVAAVVCAGVAAGIAVVALSLLAWLALAASLTALG